MAKKGKKVVKEKAATPEVVEQNGIREPGKDTTSAKIWAIANKLNALKTPIQRATVLEKCAAAGISAVTAATQYARWRKFNGIVKPEKKAPAKKAA